MFVQQCPRKMQKLTVPNSFCGFKIVSHSYRVMSTTRLFRGHKKENLRSIDLLDLGQG